MRAGRADPRVPSIDVEGASLAYSVDGNGSDVLMIQGIGVVGNGWRPQVDGLGARHRLLTFDNRGIGASPLRGGAFDIARLAADALAVADAAGAARFHLVGHSMGGVIAQAVALAAPDRVKSLALLCTFAHGRDAARVTPALLMTMLRIRIGTRPMRRAAFLSLVMPPLALAQLTPAQRAHYAEQLHPLFGHDLAEQPPIVMKQLRATARYDAYPRLAELGRIPTLVVSGRQDRIARPAYGRQLAAAIPGARYVEIEDGGHGLTIQLAERTNELLAQHFAGSLQPAS
jgi:pimeloyl-ACP methyl ester carboxylesterase